ncbi:udp-glucose 6-dehydrogenase [Anaeramoeba flamelloides]|uniref:UDP-glucose 6-dehydrogenase n=1 Tax=Anaeramoeba flamelloides TaxID=1746091 RepID=A0AAV7ZCM6_9EUKA|nr:udp-glucose 6-dehydrogenase [Anaeramoeba flamelloides]
MTSQKVVCLGAGIVGGCTQVVFASKCKTHDFYVVDIDEERIKGWNNFKPNYYEPGLNKLLKTCLNKNLFFTTDFENTLKDATLIFLSVGTPTKQRGEMKGIGTNLSYIESCCRLIAKYAKNEKVIVIEKSTVPVGTAQKITNFLQEYNKNETEKETENEKENENETTKENKKKQKQIVVLSNPEFLAEGTAIKNLQHPDRVLIGGPNTEFGKYAQEQLKQLYKGWVPEEKIFFSNTWSTELSKLTSNAMLAQRVSSINSISQICEEIGAEVTQVSKNMGSDPRIGSRFLNASVGFGGSCFEKDILNLIYLCEHYHLYVVAKYWKSVLELNNHQKLRFAKNIADTMFQNLENKKITILGFTFKKNTDDVRGSAAIDVCNYLLGEGAILLIYDPKAKPKHIKLSLKGYNENQLIICDSVSNAVIDSHALVVLTEWDEFTQIDLSKCYQKMIHPSYIFDGRNIINRKSAQKIGFNIYSVGFPKNK